MKNFKQISSLVGIAGMTAVLTGCPLPQALRTAINAGVGPATIGAPYTTGTVPTTGSGWTLSAITPPAGSWITGNVATGALGGTPDGNDFGTWPVVLSYTDGSSTKSTTVNVVVADPAMTFTPTTGFVVPYHSHADVAITIAPAPATAYTYTYLEDIRSAGTTSLQVTGPTTSATGNETLKLVWSAGNDFHGFVNIDLVSNAPGRRTLRLTPIPMKSE